MSTSANPRRLGGARRSFFGTRSRIVSFLGQARTTRVDPAFRGLRWVSAAVVLLFLLQMATGILLSLHYVPDPSNAYASVRTVVAAIPAGWILRGVHHWAGELLLAGVLLHAAVVFLRRAYEAPRQYEWVTGALLLLLVLGFRFTGRYLPLDQVGVDATRTGLSVLDDVPVVGPLVAGWLRGGAEVGPQTLGRFHATHALLLPWVVAAVAAAHVWLLRRHGLAKGGAR